MTSRSRLVYRKRGAAEQLGVSVSTIERWMRRGLIPFTKIGPRMVLFHRDDLAEFADEFVKQKGARS